MLSQGASDDQKVLILLSDMRNSTPPPLNLEQSTMLLAVLRAQEMPEEPSLDLRGVEIDALGVDNAFQRTAYWQALRRFWESYFARAGATLGSFSALRSAPNALSKRAPQGPE